MTILNTLLISFGVIVALVLLCMLVVWLEKHGPEGDYDERQRLARGNAYRISFFFGVAYTFFLVFYLDSSAGASLAVSPSTLLWFGLIMEWMVFNIYCLLTRAALPFSGSPILTSAGYGLCALFNLVFCLSYSNRPEYLRNGDTFIIPHFFMGVCFASLAVMYLISAFWKEKE